MQPTRYLANSIKKPIPFWVLLAACGVWSIVFAVFALESQRKLETLESATHSLETALDVAQSRERTALEENRPLIYGQDELYKDLIRELGDTSYAQGFVRVAIQECNFGFTSHLFAESNNMFGLQYVGQPEAMGRDSIYDFYAKFPTRQACIKALGNWVYPENDTLWPQREEAFIDFIRRRHYNDFVPTYYDAVENTHLNLIDPQ